MMLQSWFGWSLLIFDFVNCYGELKRSLSIYDDFHTIIKFVPIIMLIRNINIVFLDQYGIYYLSIEDKSYYKSKGFTAFQFIFFKVFLNTVKSKSFIAYQQ